LAPHTWGSLAPDSCGYSARTHLHGTMFQLVSEVNEGNRIRVSQIRYLAKVKGGRLFRGDNLNETFKSITSLEGWHSYTNAGHRPIGSFVYCPQVRSGCKPKKNRKGVLACSVKRKMLID